MARKNVLIPYALISGGDMSGNITSSAFSIRYSDNVGVQFIWASGSSPVGIVQVQGTIDGSNWSDLLTSAGSVSGNSGSFLINLNQVPYDQIRIVYTRTSGSATATGYVMSKQIGG